VFYIFVDTQAVQRHAFGFRNAVALVALENAVTDGHVTVLLTDVTDREVKDHIPELVTKALAEVRKQYVLQILTDIDFQQWRDIDVAAAVKNGLEEWEAYKKRIKAQIISVDWSSQRP
jgi:hypothetical protein